MTVEQHLAALRAAIPEITPRQAQALLRDGAPLIDVREAEEHAQGMAEGALALGRSFLELRIGEAVPDVHLPVLLMCGSGTRSLLAADDLRRLGYRDVRSVAGGFTRWKEEGLAWTLPAMADADARIRYARQIALPELGEAGQAALQQARVLIIGAGGLGSPAALYLAAAGVGTLGLVDDDRVERSNLHRQVLHRDDRVGQSKTASAQATLNALNPKVRVELHHLRLDAAQVELLFADYDVIVDGSDNFPTRYLVNDACIKLGLPNVYGAVQGFEGQVAVFGAGGQPCYRCLFPEPPPPGAAPPCSEAGVLGVVPGVIGLLQALEAMKCIAGFGASLQGRLLRFDALRMRFRTMSVPADADCPYCAPGRAFPGYSDYAAFCAGA